MKLNEVATSCPFCGGIDLRLARRQAMHKDEPVVWVQCVSIVADGVCNAMGPAHYSDMDAVAAWNTRAGQQKGDAAVREVERLARLSEPKTPVAWSYEWAGTIDHSTDPPTYGRWTKSISEHKPSMPQGSIRNLEPLYALASIPGKPLYPAESAQQNEPNDEQITPEEWEAIDLPISGTVELERVYAALAQRESFKRKVRTLLSRLSGGQQSVTLEQRIYLSD